MTGSTQPVVVTFAEPDYRFGAGSLTLRVEWVDQIRPLRIDGEDWYRVRGVEIGWNGADVQRREVLVRARRLQTATS